MRYVVATGIACVLCVVAGYLLARLVRRLRGGELARGAFRALVAAFTLLTLCVGGAAALLAASYPADGRATAALEGTPQVHVSHADGTYLFDGPGTEAELVFLPGAMVEATAYAPLMCLLAERGVDCRLVEAPLRLAPLANGILERTLAARGDGTTILAGHSLGGVVAAGYAAAHPGAARALVLLASYPTKELPEDLALLSVVGSEDTVLDAESYERSKERFWPQGARELVIAGGNHALFGDYGPQAGDGAARVSAAEQQEQTAEAIVGLAESLGR